MLNEQLQSELDQEAKAEAKKLTGRVPVFRMGYEAGHYDAAEKYALKWQEAEQRAERYEKALREIRKWELATGAKVKVKHLDILKEIMQTVNKALTTKQTTDE